MTQNIATNNHEYRHSTSKPQNNPIIVMVLLIVSIGVGVVGFWLGSSRIVTPFDKSPEAGFARDMSIHHANAVEMAILLRDRTEDEQMRLLALDIMLTQQAQIGQMQGWLNVWGLPIASLEPAMTWMDMPVQGLMPGMANSQQINQLRDLRGVEADVAFLNLMVPHHQSGIEMAQAVLERTDNPAVVALAQSIVVSQVSEIANMRDLLERKGATPAEESSEMLPMQHSGDGN